MALTKFLTVNVTTAMSNIKSRSHHDVAHLHPLLMSLSSVNFKQLMVSVIHPGQTRKMFLLTKTKRPKRLDASQYKVEKGF